MSALIAVVVKASILMAGAAAVVALLSRASAATRHFVWTLAIAGLLLLPIVTALPAWKVAIPILPAAAADAIDVSRPAAAGTLLPAAPAGGVSSVAFAAESNPIDAGVPWAILAVLIYVTGLLTLVIRLLSQRRVARRIAREAAPIVDPEWTALLERCAARVGVDRRVCLLRSREQLMPMTMGTTAPIVVVPADADTWDEDRRQAVLLHELAHIARRDCLTQMLSAIACAVYWVHPAVWYVARRLRIEREVACDDRVLAAGAHAPNYAQHLLELAYAWSGRRAPAVAIGMAGSKKLEGRMRAVLDSTRNRAAPTRRAWLAGAAVATALLLTVGVVSLTMTTASADGRSAIAVWMDEAHEQDVRAADGSERFTGTWEIRPARTPQRVRVRLEARGFTVNGEVEASEFDRLAPGLLSSANGPIRFDISREAGTLHIEGTLKASAGSGTFMFEPSETFIAGLTARGYARPTARQAFAMAQHDIGLAFVDELAAQKYVRPDVADLARAADHGVDIDFVRETAQAGYQVGTLDVLIRFRDHGVDPEFTRGLRAQGLSDLSPDDLLRARDHGVDAEYVRGLRELGYAPLPIDVLIRARDHGVDPEYVRGMRQLGSATLEDLIRTRDHGVDPEFVSEMRRLGYALTAPDLIRARDHGVTPDYIESMAAVGYKGQPIETLIRLRDHGVTPDYVREAEKRGYKNLPADEIIRLRDRGIASHRTILRKVHDAIATLLFEVSDEVSAFLEEVRK